MGANKLGKKSAANVVFRFREDQESKEKSYPYISFFDGEREINFRYFFFIKITFHKRTLLSTWNVNNFCSNNELHEEKEIPLTCLNEGGQLCAEMRPGLVGVQHETPSNSAAHHPSKVIPATANNKQTAHFHIIFEANEYFIFQVCIILIVRIRFFCRIYLFKRVFSNAKQSIKSSSTVRVLLVRFEGSNCVFNYMKLTYAAAFFNISSSARAVLLR